LAFDSFKFGYGNQKFSAITAREPRPGKRAVAYR